MSDLFELVFEGLPSVKSGRWERFLFEDGDVGVTMLRRLMKGVMIPTRKLRGYEIFIAGVEEVAYCKEYGDVRVRCVLGQETCFVQS